MFKPLSWTLAFKAAKKDTSQPFYCSIGTTSYKGLAIYAANSSIWQNTGLAG